MTAIQTADSTDAAAAAAIMPAAGTAGRHRRRSAASASAATTTHTAVLLAWWVVACLASAAPSASAAAAAEMPSRTPPVCQSSDQQRSNPQFGGTAVADPVTTAPGDRNTQPTTTAGAASGGAPRPETVHAARRHRRRGDSGPIPPAANTAAVHSGRPAGDDGAVALARRASNGGGAARRRTLLASVGTPRLHNEYGRVTSGLGWGGGATSPGAAAVAVSPSRRLGAAHPTAAALPGTSSLPTPPAADSSQQSAEEQQQPAPTTVTSSAGPAAADVPQDISRSTGSEQHSYQQHQQQREKGRAKERRSRAGSGRAGASRGGRGGDVGGRSRSRRARESALPSGTRIPPDVVPSLSEAELETSDAGYVLQGIDRVAADLVDCDRLDVTFEDIAGMEAMKRSLQEIMSEPLDLPTDLYPARLIKPCTGILIHGPPGCGKTLIARAVAKQSGAAFLSVKASTLMRTSGGGGGGGGGGGSRRSNDSPGGGGGGVGHSSVMVRAVFSLAQKVQPCIVFLDEADGLCYKREEGDRAVNRGVMTELMQLWDELSCSGQDRQDRVVVLAATNRPWDLDPAVQRRFSRSFQVGLPDRKMRKAVLMKALEDVEVEEGFDWRELAVKTEGYSCGDVVELCRESVRGPLREAMDRNRRRAARRQNQGLHQSRLRRPQQEQQQQQRRRRRGWQRDFGLADSEEAAVAAAAPPEAAALPPVRMRPLRMSDVTSAQARVVPVFWQAEAFRNTYEGYMCSLMDHARRNWSQ
ncbi:unnamed protein product [Ectocarpus sp. 8 AP-2014]